MARATSRGRRVWVVVLGDFGRSPRMQYHTLSLDTQAGAVVDVVGCKGSQPIALVASSPNVSIHNIPELPAFITRCLLPRTLMLILKAAYQLFMLATLFFLCLPKPDAILLQVPPAIPTLPMCWLASRWHGATFIIDWHNFAYTLMGLSMGRWHPLVRLAQRFEQFWGKGGDRHLCVTRAMQRELADNWRIAATVFYDRPPAFFRPATVPEQHALLMRLQPDIDTPMHPHDCCTGFYSRPGASAEAGSSSPEQDFPTSAGEPGTASAAEDPRLPLSRKARSLSNGSMRDQSQGGRLEASICTERMIGGVPQLRGARPGVIITSTSWTPDEDFQILLDAAMLYDEKARRSNWRNYPRLLVLITGRGPLRDAFAARLRLADLHMVAFRLLWVAAEDYPRLLGCADLGVSLHTSSSGLDLPMKVVDMFGCGLPVCAAAYACIDELVAAGHNGLLFAGPRQLAGHLLALFEGFPSRASEQLAHMRHAVAASAAVSWDASWDKIVAPLFRPAP